MTRNGHADPNFGYLHGRELTHRQSHERSQERKASVATTPPPDFGSLLGWFRREWNADFPERAHTRGVYVAGMSKAERRRHEHVPPEQLGGSLLGAPAEAEPMRARIDALDEAKERTATDYDPAHDTWSTGAAPRFAMLDALEQFGRRAPLLRRYLEAVAYMGFDWRRVAEKRLRILDPDLDRFVPDDDHAFTVTRGALEALWQVWSVGQRNAAREVA
jgi:hypothetical protein